MSYGYWHLGMIDHHVAVALFTPFTLWLAFDFLWEIVPGARFEGRAEPNTFVRVNLTLETNSGPSHVYHRETLSDEHGIYRFIVPYPTNVPYSSEIQTQGNYHFSTKTAGGRLTVRKLDVRAGAGLPGPHLTATK
jgi:hypothetical protein